MTSDVSVSANAKLNVFLRVLRSRRDGYHDVESLVVPLDLADTVTVRPASRLAVDVRGDSDLVDAIRAGGMNLALVAALALAEACDVLTGAEVEIVKRVPVAAGLGGGSSDAAATLRALNRLWQCGLDLEGLLGVGERVGSDVPAFLVGGPVVVRGRGEHVEPVAVAATSWALKAFDFATRSPDAYRWWDEDGAITGPDPGALYAAAETGALETLGAALFNDLEAPVARRHPEIARAKETFLASGALGAVMSGSGPTVAALARSQEDARRLAESVPGAFVASGPA